MRTRNAKRITPAESDHMAKVKSQRCAVCDVSGPSDAHHIQQGQHYTTVALCRDCHMGSDNGWHGRKAMWRVMKLDELGALNITLSRINA